MVWTGSIREYFAIAEGRCCRWRYEYKVWTNFLVNPFLILSVSFANVIGDNSGCPKSQQVLYMGVAADCQYVSQYGNKDNATKQILNDWNLASSLYKSTFNVSLGIIELQVQDSR